MANLAWEVDRLVVNELNQSCIIFKLVLVIKVTFNQRKTMQVTMEYLYIWSDIKSYF